jgi:hypothetical protein
MGALDFPNQTIRRRIFLRAHFRGQLLDILYAARNLLLEDAAIEIHPALRQPLL